MNELTYLQAIILGLVQGIAEFLPISSSGHLAVVQQFMDLESDSQSMLVFNVSTHVGTLVAVALVFFGSSRLFLRRLFKETSSDYSGRRHAWSLLGKGILATIPVGVVGLAFQDKVEAAFGNPLGIGIALMTTGTLLFISGKVPKPNRGWKQFGVGRAVLVGLAQAVAILPGISRSGSTISVALMLGLRRRWAGEFSFFIFAPAICGASLIKAKDVLDMSPEQFSTLQVGPIVVGTIVSLCSGYVALRVLVSAVRRAKLHHFCYYCWLAGLVVLVTLRSS